MKQALLVGLGGFIGSIARYKLSGVFLHHFTNVRFPIGTCVVNLAGCLAIGLLAGLAERRDLFSADTRIFLLAGLLGGFTTFSAFGYETIFLFRRAELLIATTYVLVSVGGGLIAVAAGLRVAAATLR